MCTSPNALLLLRNLDTLNSVTTENLFRYVEKFCFRKFIVKMNLDTETQNVY